MIVQYDLVPGQPLTVEQLKQLDAAEKLAPVFDEDCPELSPTMMKSLEAAVRNRNRANALKKA